MENWNVDEEKLKQDPKQHRLWKTVQLINYGLGEEKLDWQYLKSHWSAISPQIDTGKKAALEFMLSR